MKKNKAVNIDIFTTLFENYIEYSGRFSEDAHKLNYKR